MYMKSGKTTTGKPSTSFAGRWTDEAFYRYPRYRGHFILKWKNPTNPGNMSIHENFRDAMRQRATMAHDGQGCTDIPPQERTQQRPMVLYLRSQLRDEHQQWSQMCWFISGRQTLPSSSSSSATTWWSTQH